MIKRYIGTFHVSTRDEVIIEDIGRRAIDNAKLNGWGVIGAIAYALECHRANQADYRWVMGPH